RGTAQAGKNSKNENFDKAPSASAIPRTEARPTDGLRSQRSKQKRASDNVAAAATSALAIPACPRIVGMDARKDAARNATPSPNWRLHAMTTTIANARNSRLLRRARARLRMSS